VVSRSRLKRAGTGTKDRTRLERVGDTRIKKEVGELFTSVVHDKPIDYDFSQGYAEKWDIALDLTEEEQENEEFVPMMNYYYPLPNDFEEDMKDKFGDEWRSKIKDKLVTTTVVRFEDDDKYALALTGGGMDLSWEICESFINLGYLPPAHFCDLPRMAGKSMDDESNRKIVLACLRSLDVIKYRSDYSKEGLEKMLKEKEL
jgi:hypothetical protein